MFCKGGAMTVIAAVLLMSVACVPLLAASDSDGYGQLDESVVLIMSEKVDEQDSAEEILSINEKVYAEKQHYLDCGATVLTVAVGCVAYENRLDAEYGVGVSKDIAKYVEYDIFTDPSYGQNLTLDVPCNDSVATVTACGPDEVLISMMMESIMFDYTVTSEVTIIGADSICEDPYDGEIRNEAFALFANTCLAEHSYASGMPTVPDHSVIKWILYIGSEMLTSVNQSAFQRNSFSYSEVSQESDEEEDEDSAVISDEAEETTSLTSSSDMEHIVSVGNDCVTIVTDRLDGTVGVTSGSAF